jgi:predicted nucleotidyltransferase
LAALRLRDRDAIITEEGLIFRVFGYSHPPKSHVCDVEYAPSSIFRSNNPKAFRNEGQNVFYKFYEDEGWKLIESNYPQYMIFHEMLQRNVVGVNNNDAYRVRRPGAILQERIGTQPKDELLTAMQAVLDAVTRSASLGPEDFGVFGSLLHGFYHPKLSDIDLVVYGKRNVAEFRETLKELYEADSSPLRNEFETEQSIRGKDWRFRNFSLKEYLWHQRRKLIYAVFDSSRSRRKIKTEFEPVKDWNEINSEYSPKTRILQVGWTRILARVTDASQTPFIPSIYGVEPQQVLEGPKEAVEVKRIVSYIEEFRMQAEEGEAVYVEGNLEQVRTSTSSFYQIALTYCERYYEQVLKVKG